MGKFWLAISVAATALAQNAPPAPQAVIRSSAREVLLDLVVRDGRGHLVSNLKPEDVAVYENGVRREVRSFRLVAGSEVRAEDEKQAAEGRRNPLATATMRFNPLRTVNVVCLILNDLNPETRGFAFEAARKFVNEELRPNTFIGVFSLDASGLRPVFPFSNQREKLLDAVKRAAENQLPPVTLGTAAMLNGLSMSALGSVSPTPGAVGNADLSSVKDPLGLRGDMRFSSIAGLREIDALTGLVRQLAPLPFEKTVLLMGTGLTRPSEQVEYWDALIRQAGAGGVTFYALDVFGLGVCQGDTDPDCVAHSAMAPANAMLPYVAAQSAQQGAASIGQANPAGPEQVIVNSMAPGKAAQSTETAQGAASTTAAAQMMEMAHQDDYLKFMVSSANRQEAIRELAERTGGFLIANTNNTDKLLARVMEEVDTHYEIAYAPGEEADDGHFRKIEVKLARAGLRAETRSGYYAVPETGAGPLTAEEMAGLKALDSQPRPHAFDFAVRAFRFGQPGGAARYAITFELPVANLTAGAAADASKKRLHASLVALVKDARGEVVGRVSKEVSSEMAGDQLAAVRSGTMTWERAVSLQPGTYTVEAAVVDEEGNRASTAVAAIENREQRGAAASDIVMVRQVKDLDRAPDADDPFEFRGKRVLPVVSPGALPQGSRPTFYVVAYPEAEGGGRPEVRVELRRDGRTVQAGSPDLAAADRAGVFPLLFTEAGDPGDYEFRVSVGSDVKTFAYSIAGNRTPEVAAKEPVEDAGPAGKWPDDPALTRFREKIRTDMAAIPNYTCLETIARSKDAAHRHEFLPVDTVKLEVSSVNGKEVFAKPGSGKFDDRGVTALVGNGLIGSGMFASLARTLFVAERGTVKYKGQEKLAGRAAVRYGFRIAARDSGFKVEVEAFQALVGFKGSFWFDPETFELLRLEAFADGLPAVLNVDEAVIRTVYGRTKVGRSEALLPVRSELTVRYLSGVANRDVTEFSGCREFGSESTIRFDEGAPQ